MGHERASPCLAASLLVIGALGACTSTRTLARQATLGAMDALRNPDPRDSLTRDLRRLIHRLVRGALKEPVGESATAAARAVTRGVVEALQAVATDPKSWTGVTALVRRLVRAAVTSATEDWPGMQARIRTLAAAGSAGLVDGIRARAEVLQGFLERTSTRIGTALIEAAGSAWDRSLPKLLRRGGGSAIVSWLARAAHQAAAGAVRGFTAQLHRQLGSLPLAGLFGRLEKGVKRLSRQAASGVVRGVLDELEEYLPRCPGGSGKQCLTRLVERFSESMATGITRGIGVVLRSSTAHWYLLIIAFAGGALLAALLAWLLARRGASR